MFQIDKISHYIGNKIANELDLSNDGKEVIIYGAFNLMQIIVSIIAVAVLGFLFNVGIEALIISFTISILRKYSGGAHASTSNSCIVFGTIISVGLAVISSVLGTRSHLIWIFVFAVIIFVWSYSTVYNLAPVDNLSKPIRKPEKRKRMKRNSILILFTYGMISLFLMALYYYVREIKLLVYSLCIYGGVLWQTFTLTKTGHLVIEKIETFLI